MEQQTASDDEFAFDNMELLGGRVYTVTDPTDDEEKVVVEQTEPSPLFLIAGGAEDTWMGRLA